MTSEEIWKDEARLADALDVAGGVGTWDWDLKTDLIYANERFATLFGIDPVVAGTTGAPSADYISAIHPEDQQIVVDKTQHAIASVGPYVVEFRLPQKDGGDLWIYALGHGSGRSEQRLSENGSMPSAHAIYELKVTLLDIEPPIWRRLQVPSTIPLCFLHDALQAVFVWTDSHLHQFEKDGKVWSVPDWYEDDDIEVVDESRTALNRVLTAEGDSLVYEYDFGDCWRHEILLESIVPCEMPLARPVCVGGERSCPPEDVGGVSGYSEFLEAIFDPAHEEFDHYRKWAGEDFAPERFEIMKVNNILDRMRWPKRHRRSSQQTKTGIGGPRKKTPISRLSNPKTGSRSPDQSWHGGGDIEICFYARSLQKAAKALVGQFELDRDAATDWDVCPVILIYRQALEIHLKMLVGAGSNFLPSPTDHITLYKTHSSRWLAQIACQIIRAVKWESEFTCEGVSSLAEFRAVVNELEKLDPISCVVHSSSRGPGGSAPLQLRPANLAQFVKKLEALLVLVDETADALAAEWGQRAEAREGENFGDDDFTPTIQ